MPFAQLKSLFRTLRFRLLFWISGSVFLMVAVTLLLVREQFRLGLSEDLTLVLRAEARDVINELFLRNPTPDLQNFPSESSRQRINAKAERFDFFLQIFDQDGKLIWSTESLPANLPPPVFPTSLPPDWREPVAHNLPFSFTDTETHRIMIRKRPLEKNEPDLWFRVGASKKTMLQNVAKLDAILGFAMLGIVLVTPIGAYVLAGRATRPLAKIISTTGRLEPQHLDERLHIRNTGDELDQMSLTINGMLDRIASYIHRHQDFIADAAHELRSPLTAIRSSVEVTLNRPRSSEDYQSLLGDVMEECTRLANLVNRLLLLAEGDAGRLTGRDQASSLAKLIRESRDMFEAVAESNGIALRIDAPEEVLVPGDEFYLRQVVRNLIDNAIKFTQTGGRVDVSVRADRLQRHVRLTVSDTGCGIPDADLPRVFDRFYRGDKSRHRTNRQGGFGLGLSICQSIVKSLGGEISVTSKILEGSTFTVVLPLVSEAKRSLASASST